MSKKQVFELRMASRNNDSGLLIGKFPEPIVSSFQASNQAQEDVNMYVKEEEIQEDDIIEVSSTNQHEIKEAKGLDMKKKKRKKRYQKKSEIVLEQESASSTSTTDGGVSKTINWVGNRVDTTVDTTSSASSASATGPKYAILQIMTSGTGERAEKHVNVLHVGDWFSFTRPSTARTVVTLDDVNAEFEKQQRSQVESNKRYNKIVSTFRSGSKKGGGEEGEEPDDEVPVAFGKSSTSGRGGMKRHLTENGQDVDEKEARTWLDVDMATGASDDEDDTGNIQALDNDEEERVADIIDAYVDSSAGESDDEKEQEDETAAAEKQDQLDQAQASLQHLEGGAGQLESAMEFKQKVLTTIKEKDSKSHQKRKLDKLESDSSGSGGEGGGYEESKGVRSSALLDSNGNTLKKVKKQVSIAQEVTTSKESTSKKSSLSSSSSSSSGAGAGVSSSASSSALNEENVRAYMKRQGGRVQSKVLMKEFKRAMKDIGPSARDTFKTIVVKLTKKEEDSVLGTMLVLKHS